MSRDITPTQIQVPVFFLIRLYANAEIGVPREELHVSGAIPVRTVITALPVIPALTVIPAKAGILIRVWTSFLHRTAFHTKDFRTYKSLQFACERCRGDIPAWLLPTVCP